MMSASDLHSVCTVLFVCCLGLASASYSQQQQRLFSEMIDDLRDAYNDKMTIVNKRVAELETTVQQLMSEKLSRETRLLSGAQVADPTLPHVAFYAQLSKDQTNVGDNQPIVFDLLTTNVGGAYNSVDGIFTAPISSTYVFSWTSYNAVHTHMQTELVVNNVVMGRTWSDAADHDDTAIASNTVVATLVAGDTVWIRSNTVHSRVITGNQMSTFSGWRIFSD